MFLFLLLISPRSGKKIRERAEEGEAIFVRTVGEEEHTISRTVCDFVRGWLSSVPTLTILCP